MRKEVDLLYVSRGNFVEAWKKLSAKSAALSQKKLALMSSATRAYDER